MNIFISYSSIDEEIAQAVYSELQKHGISVWLASQQVTISSNIYEVIKKALKNADVVIALITENFQKSSIAQAELGFLVFGDNMKKLCPIVIGRGIQLPFFYMELDI